MVDEHLAGMNMVLTEDIGDVALKELSGFSEYTVVRNQEEMDGLPRDVLSRVNGVINRKLRLTDALVEKMPQLRIVARTGVGFDKTRVDSGDLKRRGIWLTTNPGNNSTAVAEFTFGLIIGLLRKILPATASIGSGKWAPSLYAGHQLEGKTIGIVGFGNIGRKVCRIAGAFGMHAIAYDPFLSDEVIAEGGAEPAELGTLLENSDIVTLHVPLSPDTEKLLDRASMARMKRGACIVNTARGELIDEGDLHHYLSEGHLGGAALDVTMHEPIPPDFALRDMENVLLTPHIAGSTHESFANGAAKAVAEIRRVLSGDSPLNPVYDLTR